MAMWTHSALFALGAAGLVKLLLVGLVAGIGIAAVGPGGVLMTVGLYAFTALPPPVVAGTAIVTHVGTGVVGTVAFARAGQFRGFGVRRMAAVLAGAALLGVPAGIAVNTVISRAEFGVLLGVFAGAIGVAVAWRQVRGVAAAHRTLADWAVVAVGFFVAMLAALFGLGGPMLCVPLLVACGVAMLPALAAAQAQSVVIAGLGAAGYALHGAIDWPLALFVAAPQIVGVVIGARLAHVAPARVLAFSLAAALMLLAPYLAIVGG